MNNNLVVSELAVDDVEGRVNDADTRVGVVQGVFTHAVRITVLHTGTLSAIINATVAWRSGNV